MEGRPGFPVLGDQLDLTFHGPKLFRDKTAYLPRDMIPFKRQEVAYFPRGQDHSPAEQSVEKSNIQITVRISNNLTSMCTTVPVSIRMNVSPQSLMLLFTSAINTNNNVLVLAKKLPLLHDLDIFLNYHGGVLSLPLPRQQYLHPTWISSPLILP